MKQVLSKINLARFILTMSLISFAVFFNSCNDNIFELNKPSWLGESIYDQLEEGYVDANGTNHTFANYVRLIKELKYDEVLKRTGSKTLFVCDDEAFSRFFKSNSWGVSSYDELTEAQKKLILNSSMINNAYLVELMSSTVGPVEGEALRRNTALSVLDSITFEKGESLPSNNTNWDAYREKGIWLMKDNTPIPMLHFLQKQMDAKGITDKDFSVIFNGATRQKNDAHIFGSKIIVKDITCKNGYINLLQDVSIPPANMAEVIRTAPETKEFSKILERYSAPFYDESATNAYKLLPGHENFTDSIFVKRYFSERNSTGKPVQSDPKGRLQLGFLEYDPGWNSYAMINSTSQADMAAIFVPANEVVKEFFENGGGKFLIEKYGSIDNIPNDVLDDLLRNLMKPSFVGSVPGKFREVLNDAKDLMKIEETDVVKSYVTSNGVVYVMNKIYAPASYVAVTAPVLISEYMRIFNWAVKNCPDAKTNFSSYLLSMDSRYSFIVPNDYSSPFKDKMGNGMYYIDPVSMGKLQPEIWKFRYQASNNSVKASIFAYDPVTGEIGDSLRQETTPAVIVNRLTDMMDYHIVVDDIEDGRKFYRTKGGGEIKVSGTGKSMRILGGGNIENATAPKVENEYDMTKGGNGKTYVTESPLLPSYKSVYKTLLDRPEFSEFFKLLNGCDDVFETTNKIIGLDQNVKFFNTYHYSVYVPTNDAVKAAIAQGLPTWEQIDQIGDQEVKDSLTRELTNFLRYHFQDNSVYIDGSVTDKVEYETAAFNKEDKSYFKISAKLDEDGLSLFTPANPTTPVHVLKNDPVSNESLYNIMTRDYLFTDQLDLKPPTTAATSETVKMILTSSYAVIHQIDKVLLYKKDQLAKMKQLVRKSPVVKRTAIKKR